MKKYIIGNAFSIQMLAGGENIPLIKPVNNFEVANELSNTTSVLSCIGHQDTANVVSNMLNLDGYITNNLYNRINVTLDSDTILFVAQVVGGRIPEGATTLPDGANLQWYRIEILTPEKMGYDPIKIGKAVLDYMGYITHISGFGYNSLAIDVTKNNQDKYHETFGN